jgi:hypothetical protein
LVRDENVAVRFGFRSREVRGPRVGAVHTVVNEDAPADVQRVEVENFARGHDR